MTDVTDINLSDDNSGGKSKLNPSGKMICQDPSLSTELLVVVPHFSSI